MFKISINNISNNKNQISFGANKAVVPKYKRILLEDSCDEFISNIIREEKNREGNIYSYRQNLLPKDLKKYKDEIVGAIKTFILNNKLHIIKQGEQTGTFIDIIKMIS